MASLDLACPAAAIIHPVLSRNADDIECQISGHLRPAAGSPCIDALTGYPRCQIWKVQRDMERIHMGKRMASAKRPHSHTLEGVQRDTIRV